TSVQMEARYLLSLIKGERPEIANTQTIRASLEEVSTASATDVELLNAIETVCPFGRAADAVLEQAHGLDGVQEFHICSRRSCNLLETRSNRLGIGNLGALAFYEAEQIACLHLHRSGGAGVTRLLLEKRVHRRGVGDLVAQFVNTIEQRNCEQRAALVLGVCHGA